MLDTGCITQGHKARNIGVDYLEMTQQHRMRQIKASLSVLGIMEALGRGTNFSYSI